MKTLQNDFTTPEQSKRLLELGVPADSANCYYAPFTRGVQVRHEPYELRSTFFGEYPFNPCWSVGRIQEIFAICYTGESFQMWCDSGFYLIDNIIEGIELRINEMDFSKLED